MLLNIKKVALENVSKALFFWKYFNKFTIFSVQPHQNRVDIEAVRRVNFDRLLLRDMLL